MWVEIIENLRVYDWTFVSLAISPTMLFYNSLLSHPNLCGMDLTALIRKSKYFFEQPLKLCA
jgi:hypothetical protein